MLKGVPTLAGRNLRLLTGHGQVLACPQRSKASAAELVEDPALLALDQEPNLLKRAKFGHTGKQLQQKIATEVSFKNLFGPGGGSLNPPKKNS